MDPHNALEIVNLAVRFGSTAVIENLDFHVARGTTLVVIGPNGSGKTVLFRALIGALDHEGQIAWAPGTKVGYVPQKLDIERDLPVSGLDLLKAKKKIAGANVDIPALLSRVGVDDATANIGIGALSGGQFQRILLAFALIGEPNVLLLDEPAAGVDAPGQQQFNQLLHNLQQSEGITIILISHDLGVVYRHAANVLCLGRRQSYFGPPQKVLDHAILDRIYGMPVGFHVHTH